jgi:hypothetical protein
VSRETGCTYSAGPDLALGNTVASTLHDNVEIHTVNTSVGIVLDTEIDVLVDTKAPVACRKFRNEDTDSRGT